MIGLLLLIYGLLPSIIVSTQENATFSAETQSIPFEISTAPSEVPFGTGTESQILALDLKRQQLSSFDDTIWKDSPQVQFVDASQNPLESVGTLHSNTVTGINLSHTELRWIRQGSFEGVANLERLFISHNRHLTSIQLNVPSLQHLDASFCSLSDVSFNNLANIESLDISNNRIARINEPTFLSNTKLTFLNLSNNDIEHIEDYAFIRATNLKLLDLSHNKIAQYTWSVTLKSVASMDISYNVLESIDVLILGNVQTLDVSHNEITSLPDNIGRLLPRLLELEAGSNPIRKIDRVQSPSLTALSLRDSKLDEIANDAFSSAPYLQWLDVSDNKLRSLAFVTSLRNASAAILINNPWQCVCNLSVSMFVLCQPSNLSLQDFCIQAENVPAEDSWFLEAANPIIWAPLVLACVITIAACVIFKFCKNRNSRFPRGVYGSLQSLPIDLIRNTPNREDKNEAIKQIAVVLENAGIRVKLSPVRERQSTLPHSRQKDVEGKQPSTKQRV